MNTHFSVSFYVAFVQFAGGCDGPGDFVDDTPAELGPGEGCPTEDKLVDSCTGKPQHAGNDNIHNYMSLYNDACIDSFTPGQIERMVKSWNIYRNNNGVITSESKARNGGN